MSIKYFFVACCIIVDCAISIGHDEVQPIAQPEPVTVSEKAAVKFKPSLLIRNGCEPYPAVNALGEISGGLKGSGGTDGCERPPLGSQVYGRSSWFNDVWAIMYAWYFPKGFRGEFPSRRHDWASAVVWIDNPALETPTILGLSMARSDTEFRTKAPAPEWAIVNDTTSKIYRELSSYFGDPKMNCDTAMGEFQDLVMWDQLSEAARNALTSADFGDAKVPFIDSEFTSRLEDAWPLES